MDSFTAKYDRIKALGEGGFGRVYLVRRHPDGKLFAAKVTNPSKDPLITAYTQQEVQLMGSLSHPNIVRFEEAFELPDQSWVIVMEYCEGGDLFGQLSRLCDADNFADEDWIRSVFCQVLLALHHCHTPAPGRGVILHRDIKPENVLLATDGTVRVSDFGLAKPMRGQVFATSSVGTLDFMAPEVHRGHVYNQKADMYSLGRLLLGMCALRDLGTKPLSSLQRFLPAHTSPDIRQVLDQLLAVNPAKRPSSAQLLATPILGQWLSTARNNHGDAVAKQERQLQTWAHNLAKQAKALQKREAATTLREAQADAAAKAADEAAAEANAAKAAAAVLLAVAGQGPNKQKAKDAKPVLAAPASSPRRVIRRSPSPLIPLDFDTSRMVFRGGSPGRP